MTQLIRMTAQSSLILLGSTVVLAGDRPHEQPTRPHMHATCSPNWGFNQTCWSRFPAVPPCQSSGYVSAPDGYANDSSQQMLYTPENALMQGGSPVILPTYGSPQRPISVFPDSSSPEVLSGGLLTVPANRLPNLPAPQHFGPTQPSEIPSIHGEHSQPTTPVPGLPPLPSPPMSAPGHSSWQPNMIFNPNPQQFVLPATVSKLALQSGTRYGIVSRSMNAPQLASPVSTPISSGSFVSALMTNNQMLPNAPNSAASAGRYGSALPSNGAQTSRVPLTLASQSQLLPNTPGSSSSYRSGQVMPPVNGRAQSAFQQTQLPPNQNYPTIPIEPLRSTP